MTITRALVLGGGGAAGNAWNIGVIAGLFDAGVDVTNADLIVGTSAGATVAAQITGALKPDELFAHILAESAPAAQAAPQAPVMNMMEKTSAIIASAKDAADMRRKLGAASIELAPTFGDGAQARWRATVAARLPNHEWPRQRMLITAVDAETGDPVEFDRDSGVALVDAVAASCSNGFSGPPYSLGGRRYIDGGYRRSSENADLAAGYDRVLVLSPLGGRSRAPDEWRMYLAAQVEELRADGSQVETILPDDSARNSFGRAMTDLSARPASARAGFEQGRRAAERLREFWG